jgi:hypothetical protein
MPYGKKRDKVIEDTINKRMKELKRPKPKISYFAFPGMNFHIIYQRRSLVGKLGEKK